MTMKLNMTKEWKTDIYRSFSSKTATFFRWKPQLRSLKPFSNTVSRDYFLFPNSISNNWADSEGPLSIIERAKKVPCSTCAEYCGKQQKLRKQQLNGLTSNDPETILHEEPASWSNVLSPCLRRETCGGTGCRACHHLWSSATKGPSPLPPRKWYGPGWLFFFFHHLLRFN